MMSVLKNVSCNSKKESIDEQMLKRYQEQVKHKYVTHVDHCYLDYFKIVELFYLSKKIRN